MGILKDIGGQIAGATIGTGLGMLNDNKQVRQQRKMQEMQIEGQKELTDYNRKSALQMWKDTNYEAQRKEMEKAGLNVGLMYGQGGGGGTTASVPSGNVSAGTAQGNSNESMQGMALMMQQQMTQAQIELTKAQTEKTKVEAEKTAGVDTLNVTADTALKEMNTKNATVQNELGTRSLENALDTIKANRDKAIADSTTAITGANVNATTQKEQIEKIKNEAIQSAVQIGVQKTGIKLNEAQINNMVEQIKIGKYNAEKVSTDQVAGKQLNSLIEKIYELFGVKNEQISK